MLVKVNYSYLIVQVLGFHIRQRLGQDCILGKYKDMAQAGRSLKKHCGHKIVGALNRLKINMGIHETPMCDRLLKVQQFYRWGFHWWERRVGLTWRSNYSLTCRNTMRLKTTLAEPPLLPPHRHTVNSQEFSSVWLCCCCFMSRK